VTLSPAVPIGDVNSLADPSPPTIRFLPLPIASLLRTSMILHPAVVKFVSPTPDDESDWRLRLSGVLIASVQVRFQATVQVRVTGAAEMVAMPDVAAGSSTDSVLDAPVVSASTRVSSSFGVIRQVTVATQSPPRYRTLGPLGLACNGCFWRDNRAGLGFIHVILDP
jgi:hypothetical protein